MNLNLKQLAESRARHDRFRRRLVGGSLMLSAGIVGLGPDNQARVIAAVRTFDDFDGDDPSDTYAIGDLEVEIVEPGIGAWHELVFFRIDALALPRVTAPPGSSAPPATTLTLTIMLASEW